MRNRLGEPIGEVVEFSYDPAIHHRNSGHVFPSGLCLVRVYQRLARDLLLYTRAQEKVSVPRVRQARHLQPDIGARRSPQQEEETNN
jgi:hypothetical protein